MKIKLKNVLPLVGILFLLASCGTSNEIVDTDENVSIIESESTDATETETAKNVTIEKTPYEVSYEKVGDTLNVYNFKGGRLERYNDIKKVVFIEPQNDYIFDLSNMMYEYSSWCLEWSLEEVDLSQMTLSNVTDMSQMFDRCENLKSVKWGENINTKNVKSMYKMFAYCYNLENIDLSSFDTSNVENMRGMFFRCQSLKNLNLQNFNTENVVDMSYMFYRLENLTSLDVSNFNTSKVVNFSNMFAKCKNLTELNLTNFNTENVIDMSRMFFRNVNNKNINLQSFNTKKVENMSQMFSYCENIEVLDIKNFDYTSAKNLNRMFAFCKNLKMLDLQNLKIENNDYDEIGSINNEYSDMDYSEYYSNNGVYLLDDMFLFCKSLETLNIHNADFTYVDAFDGCNSLLNVDNIYLEKNTLLKELIEFNKSIVDVNHIKKALINDHEVRLSNDVLKHLLNYGFVVKNEAYGSQEYYEIFDENKYYKFPNFITIDSILNVFHKYFDNLLQSIEKEILYNELVLMTKNMLDNAIANQNILNNTEWGKANLSCISYLSVAMKLLDENYNINSLVNEKAIKDYENIMSNNSIQIVNSLDAMYDEKSFGLDELKVYKEDFSQYKERGHYTEDEILKKYFKVMMWYGRIQLIGREAILMNILMSNPTCNSCYSKIEDITTYFIGENNVGAHREFYPIIKEVYGEINNVSQIIEGTNGEKYANLLKKINESENITRTTINSRILEDNLTSYLTSFGVDQIAFSVIGQKVTKDALIFNRLVKNYVIDRELPDVLDIPNVFGSKTASKILEENGDSSQGNYMEQLMQLQLTVPEQLKKDVNKNLYNGWLNILVSLIYDKDENLNYQYFMKNEEWEKKNLETFSGSYAELKHDTILYTAQSYTAEGDGEGWEEFFDEEEFIIDDRGYIQPEVKAYENLKGVVQSIVNLLQNTNTLTNDFLEEGNKLIEFIDRLIIISSKELLNESLTADDYEFIRNYGTNLAHFYGMELDEYYDENSEKLSEGPAIIADVATSKSVCLEIGTGNPLDMFVIVNVDGKLKIASGSVYDFYQFVWSADNRLTDKEWKELMNFSDTENFNNDKEEIVDNNIEFQTWTDSYKKEIIKYFYYRDDLNYNE